MSQELEIVEKEPSYTNPYKKRGKKAGNSQELDVESEAQIDVKKKKKEKRKRGPGLTGGKSDL